MNLNTNCYDIVSDSQPYVGARLGQPERYPLFYLWKIFFFIRFFRTHFCTVCMQFGNYLTKVLWFLCGIFFKNKKGDKVPFVQRLGDGGGGVGWCWRSFSWNVSGSVRMSRRLVISIFYLNFFKITYVRRNQDLFLKTR